MEVRLGYKQTEVGIIPCDWGTVRLSDVSAFITKGSTPTTYGFGWQISGVLFLRSECVSSEGLDLSQSMFISAEAHRALRRSAVHQGDLLITITGNVGRVVRLPRDIGEANINQHIARIRITDGATDGEWVFHYLSQQKVRHYFERITTGQAYPQISLVQVRDALIPRPAIAEQRAIAAALSDLDALLDGLDRLIAKKRDLKQAAMQQLLTGQTRLPGFQGEWNEVTFADLVRHHSGNSTLIKGKLSTTPAAGLFPAYSASGQDVWYSRAEHEGDAIVVSAVGSRCGKAFRAAGAWSAIANTHVVWPNAAKVDIRFLALFLDDEDFWQKSGTGQPFVLFKKTFAQRLRLPPREEQEAIAVALADMDAELAALEARREKTRALKQGMMQELLTGRTRLV